MSSFERASHFFQKEEQDTKGGKTAENSSFLSQRRKPVSWFKNAPVSWETCVQGTSQDKEFLSDLISADNTFRICVPELSRVGGRNSLHLGNNSTPVPSGTSHLLLICMEATNYYRVELLEPLSQL